MADKNIIRDYLTQLTGNQSIGDNDSLLMAKLLDSLKIAELVVFIETQFDFSLDGDDITPENFDTINAITAFLESKGL